MQRFLPLAAMCLTAGMVFAGTAQAEQDHPANAAQPSAASAGNTSPSASQGGSVLTTTKEKMSYAIGMNIGSTLHRESVDIDPALLERGLKDAMSGSKTLLTEDEARVVLTQAQQQMAMAEMERRRALGEANKTEGTAFLAANKNKQGVVTLPSGLQYRVLRQGTGPKPTANDIVTCDYRGTLLNGKEFDSSYKHGQPATLPVGRVIKGWSEALQLMPVGSKWQLFLPPDLAYGERGAGADIGPNATLIFDVDLLSIKPQEAPKAAPGQSAPATAPQGHP